MLRTTEPSLDPSLRVLVFAAVAAVVIAAGLFVVALFMGGAGRTALNDGMPFDADDVPSVQFALQLEVDEALYSFYRAALPPTSLASAR